MIIPFISTVAVQMLRLSSILRPHGSSASTRPTWATPSANSASVGGSELDSSPGGDTIDTGEVIGTVEDVSLRVTRLRDRNGVIWYVRNGEILRVGNHSQGWSIAAIAVPFALDADIAKVTQVLTAALERLPDRDDRVIEDPSVVIESM